MNEWGLPDWQDASSYGETAKWDWYRWRWEFNRRRPDLRAYFDERAANHYQARISITAVLPNEKPVLKPNEPGFLIPADEGLFGLSGIPNPRISDQPSAVLQFISDGTKSVVFYPGEHYPELNISLESSSRVAVIFNVNLPLAQQIKDAHAGLGAYQCAMHGSIIQTRSRSAKWNDYLRVLDGREQGASWAEIATHLKTGSKTPHSARDHHRQAQALCFNF